MGQFQNLIEMLPSIITRKVDRALWDWIWAVSLFADNLTGGTQGQVRYVNKLGNDTTGDGSFDNPFLTIQAAITSVTDASITKPYSVLVAPGIYTDSFRLAPWIDVVGESETGTILNPVTANWMAASFAGAVAGDTGISNVTLRTAFTADLATLVATGSARLFLQNIVLDGGSLTCIGHVIGQVLNLDGIYGIVAGATVSITDFTTNVGSVFSRTGNITIVTTDKFIMNVRCGMLVGLGSLTLTAPAANANTLFVSIVSGSTLSIVPVITGLRVDLQANAALAAIALTDASQIISLSTPHTAGSVIGINGGMNQFAITPTADRTLTIETTTGSLLRGTSLRIKNEGNFYVPLVFTGATCTNGPTYIPPFGTFDAYVNNAHTNWEAKYPVQSGTAVLTNGVSANILADITANSRITVTPKVFNGAAGVAAALNADRVAGARGAGGLFLVKSIAQATGAVVATDQGTYDWEVSNAGG